MCGIFFSAACSPAEMPAEPPEKLVELLRRRGPDSQGWHSLSRYHSKKVDVHMQELDFYVYSSVLSLRGVEVTEQPVVDVNDNVLSWNGEIYSDGNDLSVLENDTVFLAEQLTSCLRKGESVFDVLNVIKGPFALVFHDRVNDSIYFARDRFGKLANMNLS